MIYSWLRGAPYVSTSRSEIQGILNEISIKKNSTFVELGCGDGRVVRYAAKEYEVQGLGIEINPTLVWLARLRAKLDGTAQHVRFEVKNIFDVDVSQANYVYIFLFPALLRKLQPQLEQALHNKAIIISRGFQIKYFEKFLFKKYKGKRFTTYYYKISN
ncbi:MAG: cyclopropane-fatty-acyl-phospholipid synthase family protein [Weeksellaceae bacterium]